MLVGLLFFGFLAFALVIYCFWLVCLFCVFGCWVDMFVEQVFFFNQIALVIFCWLVGWFNELCFGRTCWLSSVLFCSLQLLLSFKCFGLFVLVVSFLFGCVCSGGLVLFNQFALVSWLCFVVGGFGVCVFVEGHFG